MAVITAFAGIRFAKILPKNSNELKQAAAIRAVDFIESGMAVGLGTGSTATYVVREIALRMQDGRLRDLTGVPTSERTGRLAAELGIPITTLNDCYNLDVTIDGADEVDPNLDLIKGAGGAHLREKMVAAASKKLVVVVDESKRVEKLGSKAAVPVEVVRFGWKSQIPFLEGLGGQPTLRISEGGELFITDEGHYILDCRFQEIPDPALLQLSLNNRAGVVEHGLFLGMASVVVVGTENGIQILQRGKP